MCGGAVREKERREHCREILQISVAARGAEPPSRVAEWLLFSFPVPAAAANAPRAGMNSTRPFSEGTEIPIQLVLCPANLPCSNGE